MALFTNRRGRSCAPPGFGSAGSPLKPLTQSPWEVLGRSRLTHREHACWHSRIHTLLCSSVSNGECHSSESLTAPGDPTPGEVFSGTRLGQTWHVLHACLGLQLHSRAGKSQQDPRVGAHRGISNIAKNTLLAPSAFCSSSQQDTPLRQEQLRRVRAAGGLAAVPEAVMPSGTLVRGHFML